MTWLLEHGAQFDIRNKLNDTPARASYNTKVSANLLNIITLSSHVWNVKTKFIY